MKKIPKRYLLVLSLILSLGLSGLITPSAQPIQARRYRFSRINHQRSTTTGPIENTLTTAYLVVAFRSDAGRLTLQLLLTALPALKPQA